MMDTKIPYWLFVQEVLGVGSNKILDVNDRYQNIEDFYHADIQEIRQLKILTENQLKKFSTININKYDKIIEKCDQLGYYIITPDDPRYPNRLKNLIDPPAVLFVKGSFPDVDDEVIIAMVGSRKASDYGKSIARELAYNLTTAGCIVISGGAIGIDYSAHIGALRAKGNTIAVLPCGLNYPYLASNAELREEISHNGCLISELPPDTPVLRNAFQIRNRLISALSLGTVIVEGRTKSGAKITANRALEQGKDIFAVPGDINSPNAQLPNSLIRDGAIPVVRTYDILFEYNSVYPHKLNLRSCSDELVGSPECVLQSELEQIDSQKVTQRPQNNQLNLSSDAQALLDAFLDVEELIDDLIVRSGLDSSAAMCAMTELEMEGIIEPLPGCRYAIKE